MQRIGGDFFILIKHNSAIFLEDKLVGEQRSEGLDQSSSAIKINGVLGVAQFLAIDAYRAAAFGLASDVSRFSPFQRFL